MQVQSVADALRPLLSAHQPAWNYEVSVEADSRPAETAVLAAREGFPNAPIGYLAASEVTRFDAIKAGADEAAVMLVPDSKSVSTFLDLLVLRAQLRRELAALSQRPS